MNTKWKPTDILLVFLAIVFINVFLLDYLSLLLFIADIAMILLFFYRIYEFLFVQFAVGLETREKDIVVSYDGGLKRSLDYSYISNIVVEEYSHKSYDRLFIYLNSPAPLKNSHHRVSKMIAVERATGRRIFDDIKKRIAI